MIYNEILERGTADFPASYYFVDKGHPRHEMSAHWHSEIEFIRVLSGELTVKLNTNTYKGAAGDVFFVNSQTVHAATPHSCTYECIVMHLDYFKTETESCRHFIESLYNQEYFVTEYAPSSENPFTKAINAFFDAMKEEKEGREFLSLGALYNLLGVILSERRYSILGRGTASASDMNVPKLKKVLSFIRENYASPITLSDMAEKVNMSGKYFCYFFKNMTGKTPNSYLVSYRIERAAQKLLATDESVTEIAYSCGFNDLSYFIKTFKEHKGVSPGVFRR